MSTPNEPKGGGKPPRTVTAIVARGHTVMNSDGKFVVAGGEVALPESEAARLRKAGFLNDPKEPDVPRNDGDTIGPRVLTKSTVQFKRG
ncbi:hypothetical protein [Burkholderia cenocepacia]|uniref:hypothetical protein n=1 Tax=Burkholderia cenocepacia TaxID=95486 RepID=UPI001F4AD5CD|nr:hypothetical protein [Burkholderia cenocepacia]